VSANSSLCGDYVAIVMHCIIASGPVYHCIILCCIVIASYRIAAFQQGVTAAARRVNCPRIRLVAQWEGDFSACCGGDCSSCGKGLAPAARRYSPALQSGAKAGRYSRALEQDSTVRR
jgi:hypothetical protein